MEINVIFSRPQSPFRIIRAVVEISQLLLCALAIDAAVLCIKLVWPSSVEWSFYSVPYTLESLFENVYFKYYVINYKKGFNLKLIVQVGFIFED